MTEPIRIATEALVTELTSVLCQTGLAREIARVEAQTMVEADLHGVPSHGVRMLPGLVAALRDGRANAAPVFTLRKEFGATCMLDCDNAPGRYASLRAMDEAITRARSLGIGMCLATRTTHWGRAHAYASHAARQGMIGLCTTNANPTMAVWSGKQRIIGNNPIAFGIPRDDAAHPMVLDIAMSQAAVGKVGTWAREGREAPSGWGIDAQGNASNDPKAILAGAVLPFGGHKGAGLALMMELMTAALAAAPFGYEIGAADHTGLDPESSKLFIAINPEAFGGRERLVERVADFLAYLGNVAAPFNWPGERGWQDYEANLIAGVPLHPDIWAQLAPLGVRQP